MTEFHSDRTSSNQAGVTLMNNQVGYVVAQVMADKKDITIRELPSMIRVDGIGKIDFDFAGDRRRPRVGRLRPGRLRGDHVDALRPDGRARRPRPHVRQPRGRGRVHRLRPAAGRGGLTMYEKDGEKYFIVDSHLHFWDASPENWVKGAEEYAKGWIECFHAYQGLGPTETHWTLEHFQKYSADDFEQRRLRRRRRRPRRSSSPRTSRSGTRRASTTSSRTRRCWTASPASSSSTGAGTRARARPAWSSCAPTHEKYGLQGCKLYTAEWYKGSRGWKLKRPGGGAVPRALHRARDQEHPRPQGPDDLAAGQGRLRRLRRRPRGDELPGAQLHRRARRACRGSRTSASWRRRSPTSTRACRSSSAASCTPARGSSPRSWASCCSGSARTRCCSAATTRSGSRSGRSRGCVDWDYPDETFSDYPRWTNEAKRKILGLNAAKLYGIEVPEGMDLPRRGRPQDDAQLVERSA